MDSARPNPLRAADDKYVVEYLPRSLPPRVVMKGTITTPNPGVVLNPWVEAVHLAVVQSQLKELRVDIQELEFCNSSGFKSFINWIERIQGLPEPQRYTLYFQLNPVRRWQKTSLLALSCYGPTYVVLT